MCRVWLLWWVCILALGPTCAQSVALSGQKNMKMDIAAKISIFAMFPMAHRLWELTLDSQILRFKIWTQDAWRMSHCKNMDNLSDSEIPNTYVYFRLMTTKCIEKEIWFRCFSVSEMMNSIIRKTTLLLVERSINKNKRTNIPCAAPLCVVLSFSPWEKRRERAQHMGYLFSCLYLVHVRICGTQKLSLKKTIFVFYNYG